MSIQEAEPTVQHDANTGNGPGMGGTSTEDTVAAGDEEVQEQAAEESSDTESEPTQERRTGEEPESRRDVALSPEAQRAVDEAAFVSRTVVNHPERIKQFQKWADEDRGAPAADDRLERSKSAVAKWFKDTDESANQTALREVVEPLHDLIRDLQNEVRSARGPLRAAESQAKRGQFSEGLVASGVPAATLSDPAFLKHLSAERQDRDFQSLEAREPKLAAKMAAKTWIAKTGRATANGQQRKFVNDVKGGNLHAAASTGNGAQKVFAVDSSKPGWDTTVLNLKLKHGPDIRIVEPAKK